MLRGGRILSRWWFEARRQDGARACAWCAWRLVAHILFNRNMMVRGMSSIIPRIMTTAVHYYRILSASSHTQVDARDLKNKKPVLAVHGARHSGPLHSDPLIQH